MSVETKTETKEILSNVSIVEVGKDYPALRQKLADHYFRAWNKEGLCDSEAEAIRRLDAYNENPNFSAFIAVDASKEKIYGLLLTLKTRANSFFAVLDQFPNYASFEKYSGERVGDSEINICFSITAEPKYRVKNANAEDNKSLSEFLLFGFPRNPNSVQLAYSRIPGVNDSRIQDYYVKNLKNSNLLGATGMHENAYGGLTIATIEGSRPEDTAGGRGNTLILFPKDEEEKEYLEKVKAIRKETGVVTVMNLGRFTLFLDY